MPNYVLEPVEANAFSLFVEKNQRRDIYFDCDQTKIELVATAANKARPPVYDEIVLDVAEGRGGRAEFILLNREVVGLDDFLSSLDTDLGADELIIELVVTARGLNVVAYDVSGEPISSASFKITPVDDLGTLIS